MGGARNTHSFAHSIGATLLLSPPPPKDFFQWWGSILDPSGWWLSGEGVGPRGAQVLVGEQVQIGSSMGYLNTGTPPLSPIPTDLVNPSLSWKMVLCTSFSTGPKATC